MMVHVKVRPGSIKDRVEKLDDGTYIVYTMERSIDGKANASVIKLLSKEFGVSYKNISIKNPRSRKKIIEIKE